MSSAESQSRPKASPETELLIQQVIEEKFGGVSELPSDEEQFSHPESAFALVQQYAFANGFAVVQTQKEKHRRVFSCVHYGKPPNKRKITSDAVSKEYFMEMGGVDTTGNKLRQRQGMVSRATRRDRRERGCRSVTDSKKRLGRQNVVGL
jgi:hypothetical protein